MEGLGDVVSILVSYRLREGDAARVFDLLEPPSPSIRPSARLVMPVSNHRAIVYRKGMVQVGGLRNLDEINQCRMALEMSLSSEGVDIRVTDTTVLNVVSRNDLGRKVNLVSFAESLGDREWTYEPEIFPGLILKIWGVTFLVFASGRAIMTGLKEPALCEGLWGRFDHLIP